MMINAVSTEVYWMLLTVCATAVMWIPYIINRITEMGLLTALWDPYGHTEAKTAWAKRMMRAHENAVENLIIFVPLVILVELAGVNSGTTANACLLYFVSRLVHFAAFSFAVPLFRVISFLAGFAAQVMLALAIFQIL